ncbi:hypothetical protein [Actinosynnema pretiosum]|nr:hypothetical protein [Actinosynnema pretiosum]
MRNTLVKLVRVQQMRCWYPGVVSCLQCYKEKCCGTCDCCRDCGVDHSR